MPGEALTEMQKSFADRLAEEKKATDFVVDLALFGYFVG